MNMIGRALNFIKLKLQEEFYSYLWKLDYQNIKKNNLKKIKTLKGEKRTCFILGNGSSLNLIDEKDLSNSFTIASNSFHIFMKEKKIKPDLYLLEDDLAIENNFSETLKTDEETNICVPIALSKKYRLKAKNLINLNYKKTYGYPQYKKNPKLSFQLEEECFFSETVTYFALQIAGYLNFEKIFLVGIDLDYKFPSKVKKVGKNKFITIGEDRNHFSSKYNSNKPWYLPNIEKMKFSIELACNELIRKDVKIYNISNISNFKNVENIDNKYIEKFLAND